MDQPDLAPATAALRPLSVRAVLALGAAWAAVGVVVMLMIAGVLS